MKPLAAAAFFATLGATMFHYIATGPNEVDEQEEHEEDTLV